MDYELERVRPRAKPKKDKPSKPPSGRRRSSRSRGSSAGRLTLRGSCRPKLTASPRKTSPTRLHTECTSREQASK
jgi:hypothetical protein